MMTEIHYQRRDDSDWTEGKLHLFSATEGAGTIAVVFDADGDILGPMECALIALKMNDEENLSKFAIPAIQSRYCITYDIRDR